MATRETAPAQNDGCERWPPLKRQLSGQCLPTSQILRAATRRDKRNDTLSRLARINGKFVRGDVSFMRHRVFAQVSPFRCFDDGDEPQNKVRYEQLEAPWRRVVTVR